MSTTAENAASICALMDAQVSDKEFDESVKRNRLLHECKTKGFSHLEALGSKFGGISKPKDDEPKIRVSDFEFANMGAQMVNSGKMTISEWTSQCGRGCGDLRYYCDKYEIYLVRKRNTPVDRKDIYQKARRMINQSGYRLEKTARRLQCSRTLLRNILKEHGKVYNPKAIKLEKIKE